MRCVFPLEVVKYQPTLNVEWYFPPVEAQWVNIEKYWPTSNFGWYGRCISPGEKCEKPFGSFLKKHKKATSLKLDMFTIVLACIFVYICIFVYQNGDWEWRQSYELAIHDI